MILRLATRFDTYGLKVSCEQYLKYAMNTKIVDPEFAIKLADAHGLKSLLTNTMDTAKTADELKGQFKSYEHLSAETLKEMIKKTLKFV